MAYLDSSTTNLKKDVPPIQEYISPTKTSKSFKNLTSVISNVKTKALSLVKMNDSNVKHKRKSLNAEVAKRAMTLLKTPPGSASASPVSARHSPFKVFNVTQNISRNPLNTTAKSTDNRTKEDTNSKVKNSVHDSPKTMQAEAAINYSDDGSDESDHKYYNTTNVQQTSKSIESLIKSPARRPASAAADYNHTVKKYTISDDNLLRTQSATSLLERSSISNEITNIPPARNNEDSSDDAESLLGITVNNNFLGKNPQNTIKQTKSVLKNASSASSLNKKKVLFDMDAIQMKSVSASPSQSITEKSDGNEKYELGLVNLDGEEWDISRYVVQNLACGKT